MFKLFNTMARGMERYMTHRGREMARTYLLGCNDRMLADNGFSRELLEQGTKAWPWLAQPEQAITDHGLSLVTAHQQAVRDLHRMDDRELQDLGIARGRIEQAVRDGRSDIEGQHPNTGIAA